MDKAEKIDWDALADQAHDQYLADATVIDWADYWAGYVAGYNAAFERWR